MALLTSCLCCNLLVGAIMSGVYVMKSSRVLLVWVFLMTLFCFPEMGMVAFMAFIHWKITSAYGLADLIFYVFRAAFNLLSVLCVQSQYSVWRDAATTTHTLKRLQHLHLNPIGKNNYGGGGGGGSELGGEVGGGGAGGTGGGGGIAYHNPAFLAGQEDPPSPTRTALPHYPSLTRSLSRASSLGWGSESVRGVRVGVIGGPTATSLQVRTGLPGWDPYMNRESQSEFNAANFSPASVGFMPLVGGGSGGGGGNGGGGGGITGARSDLNLYSPSSSSPTPSPYTIYHHSPPQHLYPLHLPHLPPLLPPPPMPLVGDGLTYAAATQSLDRRRYVRRWQGVRGGGHGGGGGVVNSVVTSSRSSLGGESDDLRRYRDVAL
ncbi:uncharacterized protein LOC123511787 isoform X2 [Portunus trituberculatus]|uniref:uncharacterized protein LOC123511787 isoform X2 n=1 Tax=Portunus trituberculatus TaxID=210409 RepID=UPI001E1CEED3|nr:uncharacterized protein LOC123511787 isoform X2 [Portunus trituberculatus]